MGRELSFEDMVAILTEKQKLFKGETLQDKVILSDIDALINTINGDVLGNRRCHASYFARNPVAFLELKERVRDNFFDANGIDSRNYEDESAAK